MIIESSSEMAHIISVFEINHKLVDGGVVMQDPLHLEDTHYPLIPENRYFLRRMVRPLIRLAGPM